MGGLVSSWVGNGENLPISDDQVNQVLGSDRLEQVASSAGVSPDEAKSAIAQILPHLVERLTPGDKIPEQGNLLETASGFLG